jgi:hypothetical protein
VPVIVEEGLADVLESSRVVGSLVLSVHHLGNQLLFRSQLVVSVFGSNDGTFVCLNNNRFFILMIKIFDHAFIQIVVAARRNRIWLIDYSCLNLI